VDYAGKTLDLVDKETGEVNQVEFFVAILGASQHTYCEASMSQEKQNFITSVENALHFFGGVPDAVVPDNLKSAVTKSNRYEPTLNETFLDFAEHYDTTILPARAYKPRDKSLVEGAVKILYTRIYSVIQKKIYYDLKTLNKDIWKALEIHNNTKFSGRSYSRYMLFKEVELTELSPLPLHRYEFKQQSFATVMQNGHVCLGRDKHYYSVPYQYIRKKVKLLYTTRQVEIYYKYNRIAVHKRVKSSYHYSTTKEHLASTHKFLTEWTPERFIKWASSIDKHVEILISHILQKKQHPEQAYKSCMGVLSLEKKVGKQRLINACKRALDYNIYNYKIVQSILEKGLDKMPEEPLNNKQLPKHQNIRGKEYYQSKNKSNKQ
jgi:transposase